MDYVINWTNNCVSKHGRYTIKISSDIETKHSHIECGERRKAGYLQKIDHAK